MKVIFPNDWNPASIMINEAKNICDSIVPLSKLKRKIEEVGYRPHPSLFYFVITAGIEAKIKEPFLIQGYNEKEFLDKKYYALNFKNIRIDENIKKQIEGLLNINISIIMKVRNLLIHGKPFTSTNSINLNATVENKSNPIILSNEELRISDMIEIIKYLENNDLLSIESNSILNQKIDQSKIEILFEKRVIQHFLDKTKLFYDHIEKVK
ncbi:MAG: hypothetical protein WAT37_21505 [Saprospiraceae bacterium]